MRGAAEVKDHPWLKYYPWKELYDKKLEAPFIPKIGDNFDKKYCEGPDKIGDTTKERYEKYVREENFQVAFKNFTVFNNNEETNCNSNANNKNQSAKNRPKDQKESSSASSSTNKRPMHMRSSSVSVPSSALLNHNNINSNYNNAIYINKESINYNNNNNNNSNTNNNNYNNNKINNNNNNNNINNHNSSNSLSSTVLKSKVIIVDKDLRSSSNLVAGGAMGINANSTLRSSIGAYHKQAQSYNSSLYGNLMQSNSNFGSAKALDKSADKRSPHLHDSSKSIKMPTSRLPNINSIDKLKIKKLVNSSSNLMFKYYKQSANSNSSMGASLTNQIFGKKKGLVASQQFSNLNQ